MTLPTLFVANPFCRPFSEGNHTRCSFAWATKRVGSKSCHDRPSNHSSSVVQQKGWAVSHVMTCHQITGSFVVQQKGWRVRLCRPFHQDISCRFKIGTSVGNKKGGQRVTIVGNHDNNALVVQQKCWRSDSRNCNQAALDQNPAFAFH